MMTFTSTAFFQLRNKSVQYHRMTCFRKSKSKKISEYHLALTFIYTLGIQESNSESMTKSKNRAFVKITTIPSNIV